MKRKNFPRRKATRRLQALARQDAYRRLPFADKLARAGVKVRRKLDKAPAMGSH
jgi:hypothetical protein